MNGGKNNTILLTVIGIATLLVVVVGATFAFFAAQVSGNDSTSAITIQAAADGISIEYVGTADGNVANIYPREESWSTMQFGYLFRGTKGATGDAVMTFILEYNNEFEASDIKVKTTLVAGYTLDSDVHASDGFLGTMKDCASGSNQTLTLGTLTFPREMTLDTEYKLELNVYFVPNETNQNTGFDRSFKYHIKMNIDGDSN